MLIKLDDTLITGIKDIDIQHKLLFDAINSLENNSDPEQIWFTLCDVEEYASVHFKTEENYMIELNYPDIDEHVKEHKVFLKKYKVLKDELEKQGASEEFLHKLRSLLVEWIIAHYIDIEVKMAKFLRSKISKKQ